MCEYCGCQAVESVARLTAEHDEIVALLAGLRTSLLYSRLDEAAATCRDIRAVLGPHVVVEERGLFPALADAFPTHVAALESEHRRIDAVFAEAADGTPLDASWPGRLHDAMRALRRHILAEQDGVFPAALAQLSTADWERVEAVREKVGHVP